MDLQLPVQSVPITTKVVRSNPVQGEAYSIQHYVVKFVSDLRQVGGFLQVLRSPPPGFDLTTLVVIGTDCTGSCKSIYHTLMTTTAPYVAVINQKSKITELASHTLKKSCTCKMSTTVSSLKSCECITITTEFKYIETFAKNNLYKQNTCQL
jgi:hypothetical protein